ncbi:tetratricopeptide repeat protein [Streptomyces sp. NPDC058475]|uniref:phosphorylase family protein n=1 Tax=Streptomyces sp. NPDC058475 TaxID=3346518 RepID=UPI00364EB323
MPETKPTVVVLTALPCEYAAVRKHLTEAEELEHPEGTRVERGRLPGTPWYVAVAELGEGALNAAVLTERVVAWLRPEALLFVGVAGALKDDIKIGDVVVGTRVYGIHGGKQTPEGFLVRPEAWRSSHRLEQAARFALRGKVHLKPIAVGDVVLADSKSAIAAHIRHHFNDAAAIEMEGSGVAHAAHLSSRLDTLVIRGISDCADVGKAGSDASGSQPRAADAAASAAVAILAKHRPATGRTAGSGISGDPQEGSFRRSLRHSDHLDLRDSALEGPRAGEPVGRQAPTQVSMSHRPGEPERDSHRPGEPERDVGHAHGPVPVATADLPAAPAGFTGREDDLARLLPVLDPSADTESPVVICAVSGLGGIGKTALALHASHKAVAHGWFPGGTLFVDLRGYDDDPVTADQALLALLDAFGVRGNSLPQTTAAQYALYRTLLTQQPRPMLLLLDNASDPAQLTPLLPGTDRHRVLITSRHRLTDLPARLIDLDTLTPSAAAGLITKSLRLSDDRDDRPAQEPAALAELAVVCGNHPLALQIAAAMLRRRRYRTIGSLVTDIRATTDPTATLALRPIFDLAYTRLPEAQARLLRLLALAPTAEVDSGTAGASCGATPEQTLPLLEELAASRLVTPVPSSGLVRWRLHDLVRAYAAAVVASDPSLTEEGETARGNMLSFYLSRTEAADNHMRWLPGNPVPNLFDDRPAALAWLDAERANLVAATQWAADDRHALAATDIALTLGAYLDWRRYFDDYVTVSQAAQQAARRRDDRDREGVAWNQLGYALRGSGQVMEAIEAHTRARDLHRAAGDRNREAGAWNSLGLALRTAGRSAEAIEAHTRARDLHHATGDLNREGMAWNHLGLALRKAGRTEEALHAHMCARDLHRATGDRHREGMAWYHVGLALQETGRTEEAIEAYRKDLEICREFSDWYGAGQTLTALGRIHDSAGRPTEARVAWLEAVEAFNRAGASSQAAQVQVTAESLT